MTTDEIKVDAQYFASQAEGWISDSFSYADDDDVVDFSNYFTNPLEGYWEWAQMMGYDELTEDEMQLFESVVIAEYKEMIWNAVEEYGFKCVDLWGTKFQKIQ